MNPPGGLLCVWQRLAPVAIACAALGMVPGHSAGAQFIRGTIRAEGSQTVVPGANITAVDSLNKPLVEVTSDEHGHFTLPLASPLPFKVTVKKIGWQPSSTDLIHASATDTLDMDLVVPADGVELPGVEINAPKMKSSNELSYAEARRLGWKTYGPAEVESHRNEFSSFENMMRALQVTGVKMPTRQEGTPGSQDCYINTRNGRCFTFVVDGRPLGTAWAVNPTDVYFLSILQATESSVQFGDRAPWGAILIVTRMNGDKKNP